MRRLLIVLFTIGLMINIGSTSVLARSNIVEFEEKYEVELDKEWRVRFSGKVNREDIREITVDKSGSKIAIDFKIIGTDRLTVISRDGYESESRYYLKILLNNGNNYGMFFNTIDSQEPIDLEIEREVLRLVNVERNKEGLPPLKLGDKLTEVARLKSQDMADNNYFSHTSPTYGSPFEMMRQFEIKYRTAGENIAMGQRTPQSVMTAWMNSPGHRSNILSPNFGTLGVGYVVQGGRTYWTQMFTD